MSPDQSDTSAVSKLIGRADIYSRVKYLRFFFRSPLVVSAAIAFVTLLTFSRVLGSDFVMWDDNRMIYENPNLEGFTLKRIKWIFTHVDVTRRYTPLAALNYTVAYQLFKLNPFGYHLGAWLFHGANAVLVFIILRKFLVMVFSRREGEDIDHVRINVGSGIGALLWSVHPLRVEPVAWAGANFYPMAVFFLFLSLLFYLSSSELGLNSRLHYRRLMVSVFFFVASLLSHPIGMCYFVVLLILDFYPLRRIGGGSRWYLSSSFRKVLLEKVPFVGAGFIILLITAVIRLTSPEAVSEPVPLAAFGLSERLMQALYVWAYYFWRPWYPINLSPVYTTLVLFKPFSLPFIASGLGVVGGFVVLVLIRRRWPLGLVLGICHLVLLVPVLGLLEHPYYPNDRYSLLVSVCWSALFASLLANPKLHRFWRAVILTVAIASIMTLGVLSFRQTRIWKNGVVLFEHMLKTLGDDPYRGDIYWRFGKLLSKQGRLDYAIECFEKTLEIEPQHPWAHHYLAYTLVQKGEVQQAITHYMKAVRVKPDLAEAHQNLGVVLLMQNSLGKAVSHFYRALDSKPDYLMPLESLERILAKYPESNHCDVDKVIKYAERAAESTGYGNARILKVLAAAYAASERFYKAMETAEKAVELASAAGDKELATEIRSQIQFYQKGKPYWRN